MKHTTTFESRWIDNSQTSEWLRKHPARKTLKIIGSSFQSCSHSYSAGRTGNIVQKRLSQLSEVKETHSHVMESGNGFQPFKQNTLMDMYIKCGSMVDARHVFDSMPMRNALSWNVMIMGYAKHEEGALALELFAQMHQQGVPPDDRTFVAALKSCSSLAAVQEAKQVEGKFVKFECLEKGKAIHSEVMKSGFHSDVFVGTTLVDMYGKCGSMEDAQHVFDNLSQRSVVSFNTMILGYAQNEEGGLALELYAQMHKEGVQPSDHTFVAALKACSSLASLEKGIQLDGKFVKTVSLEDGRNIHSQAVKRGCELNLFLTNTLVDMYTKCGSMDDARYVFDEMPHRNVVSWTAMILGHAQREEGMQALELYARMHKEGIVSNQRTFVGALKGCSSLAALEEGTEVNGKTMKIGCLEKGRFIHSQAVKNGFESNMFVGTTLVDMYARCGNMEDARHVFDEMPHRNVLSWTAMMLGHAQREEGALALDLYFRMQQEGVQASDLTFVAALKACSSLAALEERKQVDGTVIQIRYLDLGRAIHSKVVKSGFESDVFVGTFLADMYAKYGKMRDAQHVFDEIQHPNVVSWTAMISGHAKNEDAGLALELYLQMHQAGIQPIAQAFVGALKACSSLSALEIGKQVDGEFVKLGCLEKGKAIHSEVVKTGFELDAFVGTTLVDMYAKCGSMDDAQHVFDELPYRDVVSWTAMVFGYAQKEAGVIALELYRRLHKEGIIPDHQTFVGALRACSSLAALEEGKHVDGKLVKINCLEKGRAIHFQVVNGCSESNAFVGTILVDMYAKCGSMEDAHYVFDKLPHRDVVSWSALIGGYAEQDNLDEALKLHAQMEEQGLLGDSIAFVSILKACGNTAALETGKKLHSQICKVGLETTAIMTNTLINMYCKCGSMADAQWLFDALPTKDFVTWTALITGYARQGETELVFYWFERMTQEDIQPNGITFLSVLTACCHAGLVEKGQRYFQSMTKQYSIIPTIEHYTCMVDLLSRAGQVEEAVAMVEKMHVKPNGAIWVAILGASQNWKNLEVGRRAFENALKLDKKHAAAYVLMSNIYAHDHMWGDCDKIQPMQKSASVWSKEGQSCLTDINRMVQILVVGDKDQANIYLEK